MKNNIKKLWVSALVICFALVSRAQENNGKSLNLGKIIPYTLEVTYDKTTHLIFPTSIRYVDLGSEFLIAGKAEDVENVLRVKASVKDFEEQTNFSVITDDGQFYSFDVYYSACPTVISYDIQSMQKKLDKVEEKTVLFEELDNNTAHQIDMFLQAIYKNNRRIIKHIGARSYGVYFQLKGIYVSSGKYYFHIEIQNKTNVPFLIDFINFKVVDKKTAKRTVVQEKAITPIRIFKPLKQVMENSTEQNIYLIGQFTIADDKQLLIEVFEKNGGRHQVLHIENSDLVYSKLLHRKQLKF